MKRPAEQRGLGRGLAALMSDIADPEVEEETDNQVRSLQVSIERLFPNPDQPRRYFAEDGIQELAASIRQKGIIQPLIVRRREDDTYEIVAGERRWRAAQRAQLHDVPVIVRDYDDLEVLEIAIIENIQRADLNPIEEAAGYSQLMSRFGHTQEKLAESLSRSRSHIANSVRLLTLPDAVQDLLRDGKITAGHGRAIVSRPNAVEIAQRIIAKGLSVRDTERLVKREDNPRRAGSSERQPPPDKDTDTKALESDLSAGLGMEVGIDHKSNSNSGVVTIAYGSLSDLDRLCQILSRMPPGGDD